MRPWFWTARKTGVPVVYVAVAAYIYMIVPSNKAAEQDVSSFSGVGLDRGNSLWCVRHARADAANADFVGRTQPSTRAQTAKTGRVSPARRSLSSIGPALNRSHLTWHSQRAA